MRCAHAFCRCILCMYSMNILHSCRQSRERLDELNAFQAAALLEQVSLGHGLIWDSRKNSTVALPSETFFILQWPL